MTAQDVLRKLQAAGVAPRLDQGDLYVTWPPDMPEAVRADLRALVKEHKPVLIAALWLEALPDGARKRSLERTLAVGNTERVATARERATWRPPPPVVQRREDGE